MNQHDNTFSSNTSLSDTSFQSDMSTSQQSARQVAVKVISNILLQQGSLSTQLARHQTEVASDHIPMLKELCFGVCRQYPRLNSIALHLLAHPFEEKDTDLYAVLLLGLYQLTYMNTPDHAAVNETVEACRLLKKDWATKLMNAVLRRYQREADEIVALLEAQPSVEFNMPKWLVKRFNKHWPEHFEQIIEASNTHPPMCIRVNEARVSRETYQAQLVELGINSEEGPFSGSALYLRNAVRVGELPDFEEGFVSVQDEAAQLSAQLLSPKAGEKVLDACAAPGGKTGHLLEKSNHIELTAVELEPWRMEKIESNLHRLGYSAQLICADASDLDAWWNGEHFDKILLDVPCTATGVIRRNPDIKINRKPADIDDLVIIQRAILNKVWTTLKPGGFMLYATCSLMPEENEQQIQHFLAHQEDAQEVALNSLAPDKQIEWGIPVSHGRQLFPNLEGHDGFYYCLLQKLA
ncbi:16S rRNA (cytosine(967)-C(5))-methyltransferase RsmB [Marinomonas sp. M1K-6]|uniref:16S rRNA (cytosine(967)-C(5))-methyltransferase n=1 Tax=Marinomonas profundi TaxID=2726122 RepID=A0A847QXF9_9GAMM|nr:16S rRNA (cytosine(967)-C(5))-methyltransferase RsmB [Marinomonas profundi]NLQ17109.1 16S rRNA (cytosine(967)-C(5))-methyltransferase RsmB [Marinomonas profundi]UDV04694.1 16S rRNA (cytosine(967)-C(5))-methyltransferase RsmB [Marinomonas profundi]